MVSKILSLYTCMKERGWSMPWNTYCQCKKCVLIEGTIIHILNVNEKLPVLKFRYFGKYIIQLFGYCYVQVSVQRQAGLQR